MKFIACIFVLCCVTCSVEYSESARILAIFPMPGYSHFLVGKEVLIALAERGHQVDVISQSPLKTKHPNYTDIINLAEYSPQPQNNVTLDFIKEQVAVLSLKTLVELTGNAVCHSMKHPKIQNLIKNPPQNPPYDLVIAELFLANCYFAFGRHLNVPVVGISASPMLPFYNDIMGNPHNTAYIKESPDGSLYHMNFWQRLKNTLLVLFNKHQVYFYARNQTEIVRQYFGQHMPEYWDIWKNVALLLVNSHHSLDGIRPLTPSIVDIGGLHVKDDGKPLPPDLKTWLDDSKHGFIYMSFGSMMQLESLPTEILNGLYSGFEKLKPFRFLVRVAKPEELPPGIPDNVKIMTWVPQIKALKHDNIRAFVYHGGLNGLLEAITYSVPVIGVPFFGDQPLNIDNLVEKGVAISLEYEDLQGENFVEAVNRIINDSSYRTNMKKLSRKFLNRPLSPRQTAIHWIEYILEHGADALQSPATKLTWWQLALIDVYGAILVAVLITIYIIKSILSALIRRIMYKSVPVKETKKSN